MTSPTSGTPRPFTEQPVQMESCGAVREKGDPRTFDVYRYVCDKPAGHVRAGDLYHEGQCGDGPVRFGWPSAAEERAA